MRHGRRSRPRIIALAFVAALLAAAAVYRSTALKGRGPLRAVAAASPRASASFSDAPTPTQSAAAQRDAPASDLTEREPTRTPRAAVFDFAHLTAPPRTAAIADEERFKTNERFTQDDLRHPERYFEFAERMPELNRPEERRDTLEYFVAYREKLGRDLDAAGADGAARQEILTVIERYDRAIARLRALIDEQPAQ